MGRRRSRNQEDFDDDLEQGYFSKRARPNESSTDETRRSGGMKRDDSTVAKQGQVDTSTATQDNTSDLVDKAEKRRLKKQRQKERKKAEAAEKHPRKAKESAAPVAERKGIDKQRRKQPEWVLARQGVKYQDVSIGSGSIVKNRKKIHVAYKLRSKSYQGRIIDSSDDFGFCLGKGEVILGWDIGMLGMRQGGRRYITVPPQAGYDQKDVGAGKGGVLYFDVRLISV